MKQTFLFVCSINIALIFVLKMAKDKKTDKMVFRYHYNGLSEEEKTEIRNEFLKASELSYTTFYHKLRVGNFSRLEKDKLEEICNEKFAW